MHLGDFGDSFDTSVRYMSELRDNMECSASEAVDSKLEDAMQILAGKRGSARHRNFQSFYSP